MKTQSIRSTICLIAALGGVLGLEAAPFPESSDAGVSETSAAVLPPRVNGVTGTLKAGTLGPFALNPADVVDVDVFAFTIDKAVTGASITAIVAGGVGDANLLLLGEGFLGIEGDDDDGLGLNGLDANITRDLAPGTYYIAVGLNNIGAYEATAVMEGQELWGNDQGALTPPNSTTPIAFIGSQDANADDTTGQSYTVTFNFTTAVTGLDQSAGARFSKLRGTNKLNGTGKGQSVTIRGESSGKFVILTKNTGFDRNVKSTLRGNLSEVNFSAIAIKGGSTNVTAQLKSRGYTTSVASGSSVRYNFKVNRNGTNPLSETFLLRSIDKGDRSVVDVAGAKVKLR
jgi:hypothetical protein